MNKGKTAMKITLVMAMTADGKIARHHAHFPDWTGKADKMMFKRLTEQAGVVIMGAKTYRSIGKPLPNRLNVVMTRRPLELASQNNLQFTDQTPEALVASLSQRGFQSAVLAGGATINSLFERHRLIDDMVLTISPILFGQGVSLFSETMDTKLELVSSTMLEKDVLLLHYLFRYADDGFTG